LLKLQGHSSALADLIIQELLGLSNYALEGHLNLMADLDPGSHTRSFI
jgi:hypothetical protein